MNWQLAQFSQRKSVALILVGIAFVFVGRAQSQDDELDRWEKRPLLELDLRKFGYDTSNGTKRLRKFVDFTDASHLALAWLTLDDPTQAEKIGPLTPKTAHLHVLVLDPLTGRKQGLQEWSTPSSPVRFLGVQDGKFLTCTGNVLRLFSPAFEIIREQNLPAERACQDFGFSSELGISPSRQSFLLSSHTGRSYQQTLISVETFAPIASWNEDFSAIDISDRLLVGHCNKPSETCIREIDRAWRPFRPVGLDKQMTDARSSIAFFVEENTLVLEAWNNMAVVTADATVLFQVKLPRNRSFGSAVRSSGGERFAVIENRQRGVRSEPLDMYPFPSNDRAVVYSIPDRRDICAVKLKGRSPWPPWETHQNQLALSPDGALLAVVSDGLLRVYRLPDRNSR